MGNKFKYTIMIDGAQAMITTEEEYARIFVEGVFGRYWADPRITIEIIREKINEYDVN